MPLPPDGAAEPADDPETPSTSTLVRRAFITGAALVLPIVVTALLIVFIVNFLSGFIAPLVELLGAFQVSPDKRWQLQLLTLSILGSTIFLVGLLAERTSGKTPQFADGFDDFMAAIPGVGTIYSSARQVSEVLFQSDTDSFQDVKVIEFPTDDVYMIAFLTAEPHEALQESVGEEDMLTLFLPLAPNPFMGGFLINVPESKAYDVDITVEEGVRAIVTSGVASGESQGGDVSMRDLKQRIEDHPYTNADIVDQFTLANVGQDRGSGEEERDGDDDRARRR